MVLVQRNTTGAYLLLYEGEAQNRYKEEIQSKSKMKAQQIGAKKKKESELNVKEKNFESSAKIKEESQNLVMKAPSKFTSLRQVILQK